MVPDTVIWINNLLADFEAHAAPPLSLKIRLRRTRGSGGNPSDAVKRRALIGKCLESSNWYC